MSFSCCVMPCNVIQELCYTVHDVCINEQVDALEKREGWFEQRNEFRTGREQLAATTSGEVSGLRE